MKKTKAEIVKEFLNEKAKATIPVEMNSTAKQENKELNQKFFKALATGSKTELRALQDEIASGYSKDAGDKQQVAVNADGGMLVPVDISLAIIDKLKYLSPIRQYARVIKVGAKSKFTIADKKPTANWVNEAEALTVSKATFSQKDFVLNKVGGLGKFTYEALNDTASTPDLQNYVVSQFAEAIAEVQNNAFVNGDGSKKPFGFRSSDITPKEVTQTGANLKYNDLVSLKYALAKPYRDTGVFMANGNTIAKLVGMTDTTGRPLFVPAMTENEPDTLLGRPLIEVNEIPANLGTAKNESEIWYANLNDYIIGDNEAIRIEFGTTGDDFETDKISLRVIARTAGRPVSGDGFAVLKNVK